jgi:hypothetical protein
MRRSEPVAIVIVLLLIVSAAVEGAKPQGMSVSFQQGVDGYSGAVDTEIWALAPTTILPGPPAVSRNRACPGAATAGGGPPIGVDRLFLQECAPIQST